MPSDPIQKTIETFVSDVRRLLAEHARDTLLAALGDEQPTTRRRGPRRARSAARSAKPAGKPAKKSGKRGRRTAADLEAIQEKIVAQLKKQPGPTSEQLRTSLGMARTELQRPLAILREADQVRTEGEKRAMRYYVKGRG